MTTDASKLNQLPVSDRDCELKVIGTLLVATKAIDEVRTIIDEQCFTDDRCAQIYKAICKVDSDGDTVDMISVLATLAKMDSRLTPADLTQIAMSSTVGDLTYYACRLKELAIRRRVWSIGMKFVGAGTSEVDDLDSLMEHATDSFNHLFDYAESNMTDLDEVFRHQLLTQIDTNRQAGGKLIGTPTGFPEIDSRGGLSQSDLVILAGESSHGKTSLATSFMLSAARAGHDVAVYSMEMTASQIAARIASMRSGLSSLVIRRSVLTDTQRDAVENAMDGLDLKRIHFDDRATSSIDNILSSIRSMKIKHNIRGVVIDYLQILNVNNRSRDFNKEQAMADAARRLKNIAKELDIWVVALSQLSRDREHAEPDINRLRDSGQIAEAADVVMLVYRPELYGDAIYSGEFASVNTAGTALINVAKGRNIGTFRFICGFDAPHTRFYNLDKLPSRTYGETIEKPKSKFFASTSEF